MFFALRYIEKTHTLTELALQPLFLLIIRCWLALAFFKSGLTKIANTDSTLALFEYEYNVPIIPYDVAAWLAIATELTLPPILALGFFSRPAAIALFMLNAIAMISYPDISPAGIKEHELWQLGFIVLFILGPGKYSVDHFIFNALKKSAQKATS